MVDMERLHDAGVMRATPRTDAQLDEAEAAEIRFFASLISAGCDIALVRELVSSLEAPYAYDIRRMAYDFSQRCWLHLEEATIDEALDYAVTICEEEGDLTSLIDMGRTVLDAARAQAVVLQERDD